MTTFAYGQKGHELDLIIRDNQISHQMMIKKIPKGEKTE